MLLLLAIFRRTPKELRFPCSGKLVGARQCLLGERNVGIDAGDQRVQRLKVLFGSNETANADLQQATVEIVRLEVMENVGFLVFYVGGGDDYFYILYDLPKEYANH